uniref:Uncharacterized protein n=1 Tax=Populus trichocarpa TaxID=3694 RepID=A0A2K1YYK3_POPTR
MSAAWWHWVFRILAREQGSSKNSQCSHSTAFASSLSPGACNSYTALLLWQSSTIFFTREAIKVCPSASLFYFILICFCAKEK